MKWWIAFLFLILLACIVPFSSKRPDAVQHVLGLRGGVDTAVKALFGILLASFAAAALGAGLTRIRHKGKP